MSLSRNELVEKAVNLFGSGNNCSQAILITFGENYGLDCETLKKIARPFGGGMGRLGKVCGVVNGGLMVLGLAQKECSEEKMAKDKAAEWAQEFMRNFERKHGTILCKKLLDADISTVEGKQKIDQEDLFKKVCPRFVRSAAEILEELLGKEGR